LQIAHADNSTEWSDAVRVQVPDANGCAAVPPRAKLETPQDNTTLKKPSVRLDWGETSCATRYELVVRRDDKKGARVETQDGLTVSEHALKLKRGRAYFWRVRACNAAGCGKWSQWRQFQIRAKS